MASALPLSLELTPWLSFYFLPAGDARNEFVEMMEILDKRLNDKGKNWRHVFKALTVLDYLLHAGSENVVIYFRDNIYVVKTLKEFQYVDEYGKDQGANGELMEGPGGWAHGFREYLGLCGSHAMRWCALSCGCLSVDHLSLAYISPPKSKGHYEPASG